MTMRVELVSQTKIGYGDFLKRSNNLLKRLYEKTQVFSLTCVSHEYCQTLFNKFFVSERVSLFCLTFIKLKTQLYQQF